MDAARIARLPAAAALFALLAACGPDEAPAAPASERPASRTALRDRELSAVREALEQARADIALELLERVQGLEAECLRSRARLLAGDAVGALSAIERARELAPEHPEVAGTEAEVLAALGRVQAAAGVLAAALGRSGADPALLRARGVVELATQGHGSAALEALERARALDPDLPFMRWPLAQAHLLVGRARLEQAPAEATAHARAARSLEPDLSDALELEAEGLTGELRFEEAIALYEALEEADRPAGETLAILHQRCATRCLLERDRGAAIEHYLAARARGMDDEGLGFGAELLAEEGRAALQRAGAAADEQDWIRAQGECERALELAPGDLAARNLLGLVRFRREDFRGAALAWQEVLERARAASLELPDPVPLDLARAWRLAGERERSRRALAELLERDPGGPWSEAARELLAALEAEELAGH